MNDHGKWCEDERELEEITIDYFKNLFKSQGQSSSREVLDGVKVKVMNEKNAFLLTKFTTDEVHTAIKQMHLTKALGLDGTPAIFFQKYWHIVGKDVVKLCFECLNGGKGLQFLKNINIVLIPKIKNP